MRRLFLATLVTLLALPLCAQMRGGHGGGVYRGGAGGFRSAPAGGYHGAPGGGYRPAPSYGGVVRTQVPGSHWRGGAGWGVGIGIGYGHGYGWSGFGRGSYYRRPYYGYPGYYYPYVYTSPYAYVGAYSVYDPGVYTYYSNSDANYYAQQQYAQQQQMNEQIGSLQTQIQDLRAENDNLRDYVAHTNPAPVQGPDRRVPDSLRQPIAREEAPSPATILVFRDGHRVEVQNYAIVGDTLWALSERRSQKYALTDLDIEKTVQLNEQRGVEFAAPPSR